MARVYFSPNSLKLYQKIKDKKLKARIKVAIQKLSQNPNTGKKLRGELAGQYTLRIWPYRVIYYLNPNKDIIVTDIGPRKDVYK